MGGGKMLFVHNDILSKKVSIEKLPTESFLIELYLRKKRWLINYYYNPNNGNIESHLDSVSKSLDMHLKRYENVILLGDFNVSIEDSFMKNFCENYDLRSLVKQPACLKNSENPSCIDLILTRKPRSFIKAGVIETGLSDYHKLVTTVMKVHFPKSKPSIITYRSYKKFDNKKFMENFLRMSENQLKLNTDKCHVLLNTQDQNFLKIGNFNIRIAFPKNYWLLLVECPV